MRIKRIILDTSFLLALAQMKGVSLHQIKERFPRAEIITVSQVLEELRKLEGKRFGTGVAREVLRGVKVIHVEGYDSADDAVLSLSEGLKEVAVVTFDLGLRKRLVERGIPVIYLRSRKKLLIDHPAGSYEEPL